MADTADIERVVMETLREAREPVRESVLYERVRARGVDLAPEDLIATAERLAVLGHVHVAVERELPGREPAPFQPRYWRVVE